MFLPHILIPACDSSSSVFHIMCSTYQLNKQGDIIYILFIFLPNFEPLLCFMSGSNCFFFNSIQIYQETGNVNWYSHFFKNFPQFVMIHTLILTQSMRQKQVFFLEFPCFLHDPTNFGNLISSSSDFSKPRLYIWEFLVHRLLKFSLKDLEHIVWSFEHSLALPYFGIGMKTGLFRSF